MKLKIPSFQGESVHKIFLAWEQKVKNLFKVCNYSKSVKQCWQCPVFHYALYWWDKITTHRVMRGSPMVDSWIELKMLTRKRFVPEHYSRDLDYKLKTLKYGSKRIEEYRQEMELHL